MAVWTQPITWSNQPLIASDMNTYISDNLEALKDPPTAYYNADEASDLTTSSTSFADVDATTDKFSLSIDTTGGAIMVSFCGALSNNTAGSRIFLRITANGTPYGGGDGLTFVNVLGNGSFVYWLEGLPAGNYNIRLQWKVSAGTATLFRGAGTANGDIIPQFHVREVS